MDSTIPRARIPAVHRPSPFRSSIDRRFCHEDAGGIAGQVPLQVVSFPTVRL
jgi:hypothetical protein